MDHPSVDRQQEILHIKWQCEAKIHGKIGLSVYYLKGASEYTIHYTTRLHLVNRAVSFLFSFKENEI